MKAKIVHINGETYLPEEMGKPADNQNQGSALDRLAEIACRVCYDSFGKGRSSVELHKHIQEVGHLSVYEHCYMIVDGIVAIAGKRNPPPGLFYTYNDKQGTHRVRFNARHILDMHPFINMVVQSFLKDAFCKYMPLASTGEINTKGENRSTDFISLYIECSRACSHELVRHGDYTAISQRSTRYVDELNTPFEQHPEGTPILELDCRQMYEIEFNQVYNNLINSGVDKSTALKQARGAARMYLPQSLQTKLIFTANIEQWYHMMRMRGALAADAEIRFLFVDHILPLIAHKIFKDKQVCDKCQGHQLLLDRHTGYDNDIIETEYPCPECNGCGYKDVVKKHDVLGNYVELPILPRSY